MRNLLTRITLGATFATALTFGTCFERICGGDLTGRPILEGSQLRTPRLSAPLPPPLREIKR